MVGGGGGGGGGEQNRLSRMESFCNNYIMTVGSNISHATWALTVPVKLDAAFTRNILSHLTEILSSIR